MRKVGPITMLPRNLDPFPPLVAMRLEAEGRSPNALFRVWLVWRPLQNIWLAKCILLCLPLLAEMYALSVSQHTTHTHTHTKRYLTCLISGAQAVPLPNPNI